MAFKTVLMDTWYATHRLMTTIDQLNKVFYCTIKRNRLVSRVDQRYKYQPVNELTWSPQEEKAGIMVHLNRTRKDLHFKLFRIQTSTRRTDYGVTNDHSQSDAKSVQEAFGLRWTIEQFHRELKQTTGIERCQCRRQRIQQNHITCAFLVWARLKSLAYKTGRTVYAIKQNLLHDYRVQQLRSPAIQFSFA